MTNKKRHTCIRCGQKLIEEKMTRELNYRGYYTIHWRCIDSVFCKQMHDVNRGVSARSSADTFEVSELLQ